MTDLANMGLREDPRFVALQAEFLEEFDCLVGHLTFEWSDEDAAIDQACARFKKLFQSVQGPQSAQRLDFDANGYIPPIQTCTEAEVAVWFGFSRRREHLLKQIRRWIALARAVKARRLLLDGSFVTAKDEPGDVDAVVWLPEDFRDQLRAGNRDAAELRGMLRTREPKELFAAEDEEDWWGWFDFFTGTREENGRRKGLVEVAL